jgi:NitT/TauT family transport system substrate-binding protein
MRIKSLLVVLLMLACLVLVVHAQTKTPTSLRVGYLPATHDSLLFIAKELKLFDSSKVDVQAKPYENSVQIISDLKSGLLDVGIPGVATPAVEIGGKAPLSIIGGAATASAAIVTQPQMANQMIHLTSYKDKVRLLKGKRVGAVRGSTGLAIFKQAMFNSNITEKDFDLRTFTKPSEIISALVANDLDAGLLWSPSMTLAEGKGLKIGFWMTDVLPNHVCCRQVARDEYLKNDVALVEYLAGLLRAEKKLMQARRDPRVKAEVFKAVRSYLPTLNDQEIQIELFDQHPRTSVSPDLDRQGIHNYLAAMETAELMRHDQCQNVEDKIRSEFLEKAYQRVGCSATIAKSCVTKPSSQCECMR